MTQLKSTNHHLARRTCLAVSITLLLLSACLCPVKFLLGQEEERKRQAAPKVDEYLLPGLKKKEVNPRDYWRFFEAELKPVELNEIDRLVFPKLKEKNLELADPSSDSVFVRRVYFDLTGGPPSFRQAYDFIRDGTRDKRARLIDKLLDSDEFNDYYAMKWCDLLRVKSEFPINLWPVGSMVYYTWVHDALRTHMPYDEFVRALLLADGSDFRDAPANFFRAINPKTPGGMADAVAKTFMGVRIDGMTPGQRDGMTKFFSRMAMKKSAEWKEEIIFWDRTPLEDPNIMLPNGTTVTVGRNQDPRELFVDWLVNKENHVFNQNVVNRIWYWLFSRGLVHEPDDFRDSNPPVYPELLQFLELELVRQNYDLRAIYRLIMNSHIYQQSSIARGDNAEEAMKFFACYPVHRHDAEVIQDTFIRVFKIDVGYKSEVPEPFTYISTPVRTVMIPDSGITNSFLETFGRASRDSGTTADRNNKTSQSQQLFFLNSTEMNNWTKLLIKQVRDFIPKDTANSSKSADEDEFLNVVWMTLLSRLPSSEERARIRLTFGADREWTEAELHDIIWAVVNTKEFLCQH
ncbi:MAG: DUF1553 domain-containing protein [Planctomycetia bacterium]|nr:DUF1553 domain-containing protein [Planctomycetia bacterium]